MRLARGEANSNGLQIELSRRKLKEFILNYFMLRVTQQSEFCWFSQQGLLFTDHDCFLGFLSESKKP